MDQAKVERVPSSAPTNATCIWKLHHPKPCHVDALPLPTIAIEHFPNPSTTCTRIEPSSPLLVQAKSRPYSCACDGPHPVPHPHPSVNGVRALCAQMSHQARATSTSSSLSCLQKQRSHTFVHVTRCLGHADYLWKHAEVLILGDVGILPACRVTLIDLLLELCEVGVRGAAACLRGQPQKLLTGIPAKPEPPSDNHLCS